MRYTGLLPGKPESEFNEFKPRLKSAKNRFQMSAGLNLETLNTILSGTNHIRAASQINSLNSASDLPIFGPITDYLCPLYR